MANAPKACPLNCIRCHAGKGNKIKYVVRWYCYVPADNTVKLKRFSTFPSISSQPIGAGCGRRTQGDKDRDNEIGDDKEGMAPTLQAKPGNTGIPTKYKLVPGVHGKVMHDSSTRKVTAPGYCTLQRNQCLQRQ